jgi:RHS repeat-associated protein
MSLASGGKGSSFRIVALGGRVSGAVSRFLTGFIASLASATVALAQPAPVTLTPTADAYVLDGAWAGSNFGTAGLFTETRSGTGSNYDSYLKFDTSSIGGPGSVAAARLRVSASLASGAVGMSTYAVSDTAWSETAITWNNKPALGGSLGSVTVSGNAFTVYELDVSAYVIAEKAAGRNVVSFGLHNPSTSSQAIWIHSRESGASPQLVITPNAAPTVSLTAPAAGAVFIPPASVTVTANAADLDGSVAKVEFFDGPNLVGTATGVPYSATLTNPAAGAHTLSARAIDNLGLATTSGAVTIRVDAPPTVSISAPANNAVFTSPANITLTASATDTDGTVAKVDFYDGATLLGTSTATPYSLALTSVVAGAHAYTARATDSDGAVTASSVVNITVNVPPTVSISAPANNAVFATPASITITATAADADGTIAKVDLFDGATLVGTLTAAPYSLTITNAAAGAHALSAKATDNLGATTTSATVSVIVDVPPAVSLTSPANNAVFNAPAGFTLTATASDADGTIAKVDFYQGATLLGSATTSPYSFSVSNLIAGSYSFSVVATDERGIATTSPAISVRVNALPTVSLTSPTTGAVFITPAAVTLTATAADGDGSVTKVDFYQGTTLISTATAAPYTATANLASGTYSFTAVASDNDGAQTTSDAVSVTVDAPPGVAVTSPASGATFNAPANIPITVSATDADGTIARVEVYANGSLVHTLTAPSFSFILTGVPTGAYSLTAKAFDDLNASTISTPVNVSVGTKPLQMYFIEVDHLNTPRRITDANQQVVWKWDQQEPFGATVPDENPSGQGVFDFPIRFPGQYFDKETGLVYNIARNYWPDGGRYVESDPIGLRGGVNPYVYVLNDPLSLVDPKGLQSAMPFPGPFPGQPSPTNVVCAYNPNLSVCNFSVPPPRPSDSACFVRCTASSLALGYSLEAAAETAVERAANRAGDEIGKAACKVVSRMFFYTETAVTLNKCYQICWQCDHKSCPPIVIDFTDSNAPRLPPLPNAFDIRKAASEARQNRR